MLLGDDGFLAIAPVPRGRRQSASLTGSRLAIGNIPTNMKHIYRRRLAYLHVLNCTLL
jgi:hypothetical protein